MRKAADRALAGSSGLGLAVAGNLIGYTAVTLAGNANLYLMRRAELDQGILLKDFETG